MTKKRKIDYPIMLGLVLFLVTVLFPPYQYTFDGMSGAHDRKPAGYFFILSTVRNPTPYQNGPGFGVQIDFGRLVLEWTALAAIAGMYCVLALRPAWLCGDKAGRAQKIIPRTG